jgi:hypothetical protein
MGLCGIQRRLIPIAMHLLWRVSSVWWGCSIGGISIVKILGTRFYIRYLRRQTVILRASIAKVLLRIGTGQSFLEHSIVITNNGRQLRMQVKQCV